MQKVRDITIDYQFISDSQEVKHLKQQLPGLKANKFDSFFVKVEDGDYKNVFGMEGIIPHLDKSVFKIL